MSQRGLAPAHVWAGEFPDRSDPGHAVPCDGGRRCLPDAPLRLADRGCRDRDAVVRQWRPRQATHVQVTQLLRRAPRAGRDTDQVDIRARTRVRPDKRDVGRPPAVRVP